MFRHYNAQLNADGSYSFVTGAKHNYSIYFLEYRLTDADGNVHIVYNFTFFRNDQLKNVPFVNKYDPKISHTIILIVNDFFVKNEDKALLYFCFNDDGYGRHRMITFKKWSLKLQRPLEYHYKTISTIQNNFYGAFIITKDNPLKKLMIDAFGKNIDETIEMLNK